MVYYLFLFDDVGCTGHSSDVCGEMEFQPDDWACDVVDVGSLFSEATFLLKFVGEVEVSLGFCFIPEFVRGESDAVDVGEVRD